jgi:molecular chaperone DnaK
MYKTTAGAAPGGGGDGAGGAPPPGAEKPKDNVVDAEFVDVDDKKK